jgi:hypothetical protein
VLVSALAAAQAKSVDPPLQFRPESVKQTDSVTDLLSTVALEPPTTGWPLDDDPGAKAALSWLGSQDSRLGPNPRTAYWRPVPG